MLKDTVETHLANIYILEKLKTKEDSISTVLFTAYILLSVNSLIDLAILQYYLQNDLSY